MRLPLNLGLRSIDEFTLLVHGGPGSGKTHLMGDALYHEQELGRVGYVNIAGQDGWLSLAEYGLEDSPSAKAETVESMNDFLECMAEYEAGKYQCLCVDSVRDLLRICVTHTTGLERPPAAGQRDNEYGQIYHDFERCLRAMRRAAKRVITCSNSDRSTDQLTNKVNIVPDLMGRQGNGVAALFNFVGFLSATTTGLGKVKRELSFQPMSVSAGKDAEISILTRQSLARAITKPLAIPEGKGAWPALLELFTAHLSLEPGEAAPAPGRWKKS